MHIYDLDTPAIVIDLDVLERNIQGMAAHCAQVGIPLRVHTKTHKIPEIARMQLAAGAIGIVSQKATAAEVMARAGIADALDILIPYNIVGLPKVRRLLELTRWATVTVAVDSEETALGISQQAQREGYTVRTIVELDTGAKRCGVQSPSAALALAERVAGLPGLSLQGIMTYPSSLGVKPFLQETVELFHRAGLPCTMISGGGTGAEAISQEIGCTETRSGSYAYEGMTRISGSKDLSPERCPVRVVVTVVSTPTPDRIIIDGGQETFTSYPPKPYGLIIEQPQARINGMSVEHGHVDVSQCAHRFQVGEKLSVIPLHAEMTSNLHDEVVVARQGQVEGVWSLRGRGRVR